MASIFSKRRKTAKKARKSADPQKPQYELEAIEPRILLAANPTNLGDATAQQKVVDLFAKVDAVGTALNADAKATEKAPLVGLSANELFPGLDFGDFLKGFQTAASTYFAGAATDTTDGLVAALNQRAKDILGVTTGTFVSGASSTTNTLKLDFDFSSLSKSQDVFLNLGNSAEDLSLKLQNGTKVTVNSQANVKFSVTADLTGTLSDESKYDFTRTEYSVTGDVSVAAAANKDFGIQIGVLGGKGMSTLDATGAYVDNAVIDFDLTLNSTFTADNKLTLTELNGFGGTITNAFTTAAPLSATTNFVRVELPIKVDGTAVGGLAGTTPGLGVAGNIKFYDDNVLDDVDPLIRPQGTGPGEFSVGLDTFRNFGRVTANDLLGLVSDFNTWASLFQNSSTFGADIPFLSASLGSAYDFGTLFTTMLQSKIEVTENVLTAPLVPTNLDGVHTFSVAVNATNTAVTIGAGSGRTLDALITQLNTALPSLVRARVTAGDNPRIEFYSAEANPFLITGMSQVADTLGLGFSSFNNVIGQLPNAVTAATLPTLKISSSSAITTFSFATATTFQIARNGGSLVTVTLGAGDYVNVLGLQLALRDALLGAGVLTAANSVAGTPEQGVTVALNANGGLDLIALADTRSIQVANGPGGNLGRFNFSASTVTAPSFSIAVNGGAATTVYINPNLTDGTIGSPNRTLAAGGLADIIADVHDALVRYGVLDVSANTGIDVRDGGGGKLEFYALNPGSGTGKIQSFAITGASVTALGLPSGTANGVQMLVSQTGTRPKFGTIQELAALLKDPNSDGNFADSLLNGTATPQYVAVNNEVTFPIKFSMTLDPITGVPLSLGTTAGDLTNISTTSTVTVNSTVSAEFEFGFKMTAPTLTAVDLEVSAANDYVSPEGHADGNVGDPLVALSWNGELTRDAVFRITLDDAVERIVTVTAASTTGNLSMQDLIDDINTAIRGVAGLLNGAASLANQKVYATLITATSAALSDRIAFRTNHLKTDTSSLSVKVDAEFVANVANAAQTLLGFAASTSGTGSPRQVTGSTTAPAVLTSDALFTITVQNGAPAAVRVYAEDTTDNVLLSDLIDDINQAIRRQVALMSGGTELEHQVVQASASGSNIRLQINALASSSNSLLVQTAATYQASNSNGAVTELGFAASGVANADISELTVTAETDAVLNLPTAAAFRVSLDGGAGQTVTVAAANYASLAALLTAINSGLSTAGLGAKMRAAAFGETGQIRLIVTDATVNSIRVDADAANAAVTNLGLNPEGVFARARGGTYFVDNVTLEGVATVSNNAVQVDANLGPVAFKSGTGSTLDLRAAGRVLLQDATNRTRFTINELGNKLVNDELADVTVISGGNGATGLITIFSGAKATYATLDLKGLTMAEVGDTNPNTTSITGLSFGLNPEIKLELKTADAAGTIQSINLNNLNTYTPTYTDLNNVDKLARLTFADVVQGLYGTAEFISDFMAHDRPGVTATVFGQKLPFIDFSLLELVDFGALFKAAVDAVAASQPRSLQEFERALESALGVNDTGVSLAVVQSAGAISLQVLVDWEATFNKKLPLYVDLSILGRAWGNEPLVSQDLAMSVIATGENNLLVDLAARAKLHLDLGVKLYDGTNRIYPTPVMRDATRMDVDVNLAGTNMNFNVPVGPSTVQIRNGAVVINANGAIPGVDGNGVQSILDPAAFNEALAPDTTLNARVATTANLAATYDNVGAGVGATLTGTVAGSLNQLLNGAVTGIDGVTSLAVNDLVLVMRQTNGAQNGLYQITALGSTALSQTFVLTRVSTADEVTEVGQLRIRVAEGAAYGKQLFKQNSGVSVMGVSGQDYIRLIEPMRMSIDVAGDRILPWAVRVATTAALVATYNSNAATLNLRPTLTANANGDLNDTGIDGIKILNVGDLVLVKNQAEAGYNGIYRIKSLGSATTAWVLERTEFADSATEVTDMRAAVQEGSLNGGKRFKQTLVPTAIGAGFGLNFSSTLSDVVTTLNNTVNELWAATPVNGQGQALLPLSVVTFNAQGQSDFTTLGPLSITINNDTNYVPDVSGFSGMQRYLDMATPGPVVNQAGNFFTVRFATPLPQVSDFIPKTDVRLLLRDPVLLADSLDLSLFNLQFAMDTATGQRLPLVGTLMTDFTQYIEGFRVALTTALRNNLRGDILNPLTVARDTLWNVLGTDGGGLRYMVEKDGVGLLNKQDVIVKLLDINGNDTGWNINAADIVRDPDQDGIDDLPTNAYSIEFGLHLKKQLAPGNLDQIDLAVPATGFDLSPKTDNQGVNLQTFFDFDFTFGLSLSEGFYLKENPDGNAATADIKLTFAAALDGDLAAAGVQDFTQAGFGRTSPDYNLYTSTMFDLTVVAKDLKGSPIAFDLGDGAGAIHGGNSGFYGTFTFDITDGRSGSALQDKHLSVDEQYGKRPTQLVTTALNADNDVQLQLATHHPNSADIGLDWHYNWRFGTGVRNAGNVDPFAGIAYTSTVNGKTVTNPSSLLAAPDGTLRGTLPAVTFVDIKVDLSTIFGGVLKPAIDFIQDAIDPFRPFIDFMKTEIPGLSTILGRPITVLDLAAASGTVNPAFLAAIKALDVIQGLVNSSVVELNAAKANGSSGPGIFGKGSNGGAVGLGNFNIAGVGLMLAKGANDDQKKNNYTNRNAGGNTWENYKKDAQATKATSRDKAFVASRDVKPNLDSGGGIVFGFLDPNEIIKLLNGQPADLFLLDLPKFSLAVSLERSFPLPPFPAISAKIRVTISAFFNLGFGWDTEGFYLSDVHNPGKIPTTDRSAFTDTPEFGLSFRITVGGALNLAVIEAGIEAYFEVAGTVDWNDPNKDGKIRESERVILRTLPGGRLNEIDINVKGQFGITIYADVFALFDWVRVFEYGFGPWVVFNKDFLGNDPATVPATLVGDTLYINIGPRAAQRVYPNVTDIGETVKIENAGGSAAAGETVKVTMSFLPGSPNVTYSGVKKVIAVGGAGDDTIDARGLLYAAVDFDGGDGNDVLIAGAAATLVTVSNRNILRGGAGNDKIYGSQKWDSLFGGAGNDELIAYGTPNDPGATTADEADNLDGGAGTDTLDGGRGADAYVFQDGWGRDRIVEQNDTAANTMNFSAVTTALDMNLGRILYSVSSGSNYAFADPGLFSRVDGGSAGDRINVTNFFASMGLTIDGHQGADFYAVTLGDSTSTLAAGTLTLTDTGTSGKDTFLLLPTRADEIEATINRVLNGRETVNTTGLEDFIIDAGSFTVRLGQSGVDWVNLGERSVVTAGVIKMLSSLEANSFDWALTNGMSVDKSINARNNGNIRIELTNPDPNTITNFTIGANSGIL